MITAETTTLENGFKVAVVHFSGIESVSFILTGRAGSNYEEPGEIGVAHFLEHLLFDGSKKYPTSKEIHQTIVNVGGYHQGTTSRETTFYVVKVLRKDLETALDYLSQLVMYPLFKESDVIKEKEIIKEEINRRSIDQKYQFAQEVNKRLFFNNQRVSEPNPGTVTDVENLNRATINIFYQKYYCGNNYVLSICGDVDTKQVFWLVEKYFGTWQLGTKATEKTWNKNLDFGAYAKQTPEAKQATLNIEWWAYDRYDERRYAAAFLRSILGQTSISRLATRIREEMGLAYSVSASLSHGHDWGTLSINAGIAEANLDVVVKIIAEEINKISKQLVDREEFARVKNGVMTNFAFAEEDSGKRASFYANHLLGFESCDSPSQVLKKYQAVTSEEILAVAKDIFSKPPKLSVLSKNITTEQLINSWNLAK